MTREFIVGTFGLSVPVTGRGGPDDSPSEEPDGSAGDTPTNRVDEGESAADEPPLAGEDTAAHLTVRLPG